MPGTHTLPPRPIHGEHEPEDSGAARRSRGVWDTGPCPLRSAPSENAAAGNPRWRGVGRWGTVTPTAPQGRFSRALVGGASLVGHRRRAPSAPQPIEPIQEDPVLALTLLGFTFSGRLALEIFVVIVVVAAIGWYVLVRRRG